MSARVALFGESPRTSVRHVVLGGVATLAIGGATTGASKPVVTTALLVGGLSFSVLVALHNAYTNDGLVVTILIAVLACVGYFGTLALTNSGMTGTADGFVWALGVSILTGSIGGTIAYVAGISARWVGS